MKILIIEWASFGKEDIDDAFIKSGHNIVKFSHPDYDLRHSDDFISSFSDFMEKENADLVLSSNYFPLVSRVCQKFNKPYVAWVYDCPHLSLYSATVINKCNYIFTFDKATSDELNRHGITTVHYLPLAAAVSRLDGMVPDNAIHDKLDCDVSFVGSMYDEIHNLYDSLTGISPYTKGYLDAIMQAQTAISGYNFIEELLSDKILSDLRQSRPYTPDSDGAEMDSYIYSRFFIDRKITELERKKLLRAVSDNFNTNLYTHNPTPYLPNIHNFGAIDPYNVMPYVFKCSRINLNITLRSIYTGIPLRAIDIMGSGGFLMSNYQPDMDEYFENGTDYIMYDGNDDLINKCRYYLEHEDERTEIAASGHEKIKAHHTYEMRLNEILNMISN